MNCKWGYNDCINQEQCLFCTSNGAKYKETKKRYPLKRNVQKPDKRQGSGFEYANHKANEALLSSKMTINSGATAKEKGDEQIRGIIRIMEELKTQMPNRAKGTKSFAIKRQWLDKLNREAKAENMEFWYLKFAFSEDEGMSSTSPNIFVVTEQDIIMSMVKTMYIDRKKAHEVDAKINFYKKRSEATEAELVALKAKLEEYKAAINLNKLLERQDD